MTQWPHTLSYLQACPECKCSSHCVWLQTQWACVPMFLQRCCAASPILALTTVASCHMLLLLLPSQYCFFKRACPAGGHVQHTRRGRDGGRVVWQSRVGGAPARVRQPACCVGADAVRNTGCVCMGHVWHVGHVGTGHVRHIGCLGARDVWKGEPACFAHQHPLVLLNVVVQPATLGGLEAHMGGQWGGSYEGGTPSLVHGDRRGSSLPQQPLIVILQP